MRNSNSSYPNAYTFPRKLLPLLICCFLFACGGQNKTKQILSTENQNQISESAININTASVAELVKLPNVGEKTAREIIKYREKFGSFRKPEHLLLVRGISVERFRELRTSVKVE